MPHDVAELLRAHGIQPSVQRLVIAQCVLHTDAHPTALQVWSEVQAKLPLVSRATVYNTLNLLVEKKLLRQYVMDDGRVVFDANVTRHHHFTDEETGRIYDVPWEAVGIAHLDDLGRFEVRDYQVVMRGRLKKARGG